MPGYRARDDHAPIPGAQDREVSTSMKLLDLFCGAGGAARGYQLAGFHVTGVDIVPQPRYIGDEFYQADALEYCATHGREFDVIHASPPCQFATRLRSLHGERGYTNWIPQTRDALQQTGLPYVIENVEGARVHLHSPVMLCGTMFGLRTGDADLWRHRLFEINGPLFLVPSCQHRNRVIGIYGGHGRDRRVITVVGHTGGRSTRLSTNGFTKDERNEAMGIDWMTQAELSQAIPPAYTEFIGRQLLGVPA
jgi:DNA (cytosine-5)-methyltransferase 1